MVNELPSESEASRVYMRFKKIFGDTTFGSTSLTHRSYKNREGKKTTHPFESGRDPSGVGNIVNSVTRQLGWDVPLAQSDVLASWPRIVGEENALHSFPLGITEEILSIQCDSTAWATQLRLIRGEIMARIAREFGEAAIQSITFIGPGGPSWKKGPRSIRGRGPRDTYG